MFGLGKKKVVETAAQETDKEGWTREEQDEWKALTDEYCNLLLSVMTRRAFYDCPHFRTKYPRAWAKVKDLPEPPPRKL